MADTLIPEAPVVNKQETLVPPMQPGTDHSDYIDETRQTIAAQLGTKTATVVPDDEREQKLAETNIKDYLEKMGAIPQEKTSEPENSPTGLEKLKEDAEAFNPFNEETVRTGPSVIPFDLEKRRSEEMGYQEEEKAA